MPVPEGMRLAQLRVDRYAQREIGLPLYGGGARPWLTVDELSRQSKIAPKRVQHVLWTMRRRRWVEQGPGTVRHASYRVTPQGVEALALDRKLWRRDVW